ncbi:MAG: cytochrome c [Nitrospinae bacterium]|nr:cytochrome c [Nitrospinota bacterium]
MRRTLLTAVFFAALGAAAFAETADEGAAFFEARCALCHQLPDPAMLKPQQWDSILKVMQKRIEQKGMPQLPDDEVKAIREFLRNNARR